MRAHVGSREPHPMAAAAVQCGAAEPTATHYLDLNTMNRNSAKIGTFVCGVSQPQAESYTYRRRSGAGMQTQHKFKCLLLGSPDADGSVTCCYGMAIAKDEKSNIEKMAAKLIEGTVIKISKVTFEGPAGNQYNHTPIPFAVDLKRTSVSIMSDTELLMSGMKVAKVALPPRTVAETSKITSNKATDVVGLVKELSADRTCDSGVKVADAIIVDGSSKGEGKAGAFAMKQALDPYPPPPPCGLFFAICPS